MLKKIKKWVKGSSKKFRKAVYELSPREPSEPSFPPPYSKWETSNITLRLKYLITDLSHYQETVFKCKETGLALVHMKKALRYIKISQGKRKAQDG